MLTELREMSQKFQKNLQPFSQSFMPVKIHSAAEPSKSVKVAIFNQDTSNSKWSVRKEQAVRLMAWNEEKCLASLVEDLFASDEGDARECLNVIGPLKEGLLLRQIAEAAAASKAGKERWREGI